MFVIKPKKHSMKFSILLLTSIFMLSFFVSCDQKKEHPNLKQPLQEVLWYNQPSANWFEALPLGNGRMGAMVFGAVNEEHLQLNEESLWAGTPEDPFPKEVAKHYKAFQKLNLNGKYDEALDYAEKNLAVSPTSIRSYQPLGDVFIDFNQTKATNYKRSLDLASGISTVQYTINGEHFVRESFISAKYDVVFYHIKSSSGTFIESKIRFEREKDIQQSIKDNQLLIKGQIFDDPNGYDDNEGGSGEGGHHMKFTTVIGANTDGIVIGKDKQLAVKKASSFTVVISAATDYNSDILNYDRNINAEAIATDKLNMALSVSYEQAKRDHIATHSKIYNRVQFNIAEIEKDTIPTNIRIANVKNGKEDKFLTQVFFQYGRYLLMNSSGFNAKLPANLQGIWNKDMWAAWESDYHLNINLQMNYWPADICNLSETMNPLSDFMVALSKKGKTTAKEFINSEGWMAHHVTNIFGRTTPSGSNALSQINNGYSYPMAGAWMSLTLFRHYEFNNDEKYLRETAYPVLKGAAQFVLDFLQKDKNGKLVTAPSYSPENAYLNPATGTKIKNTVSATMDLQIIRQLFKACITSEKVLKIDNGLSETIENALANMTEINRIGANGTLMEWIEDYEEVEPGHRHISHLFDLYPAAEINKNTPLLFKAAKKTIDRRLSFGGGQTGWSRAWSINFFARLNKPQECAKNINALLGNQVFPNLFDWYPRNIFQIDGNLGATAGIAEMLIQSHNNTIEILPALPSSWATGHINGLKARGGFIVDISWDNNKPTKIQVFSKKEEKITIRFKEQVYTLDTKKNKQVELVF